MSFTLQDIQDALYEESQTVPVSVSYQIEKCRLIAGVWHVTVNTESGRSANHQRAPLLDEAMEGAAAWWFGPPKGKAEVLAVIPEESTLLLADASCPPPSSGWIKIYTQDYLSILTRIWARKDKYPERCLSLLSHLSKPNRLKTIPCAPVLFPHLRSAQQDAFDLVNFEAGYLWGPPGTGKTTTIGAIMATAIISNPDLKILLVGTTNQAVDQALVSVDKALQMLGPQWATHRKRLTRIGSAFLPEYYEGRDHLIPIQDKQLLATARAHELNKPPEDASPEEKTLWLKKQKDIRERIRKQLLESIHQHSIVAMTACRSAFSLDDLLTRNKPFDLIVFDESSQLGLAHVLPLLPLGSRYLFAGDDRQLSPIVVSKTPKAQRVLTKSPFIFMQKGAPNMTMLDEQSRMAERICHAVSHAFYDGDLKVAADALKNRSWIKERRVSLAGIPAEKSMACIPVKEKAVWSKKYNGQVRHESATAISTHVKDAIIRGIRPGDITVLTPYRAQRVLIKHCLYHEGIKGVTVSTVHRSQGSESLVILFDPVKGEDTFLYSDEGFRLINVAISRAKAKLVLYLGEEDRTNPKLQQLANLSALESVKKEDGIDLLAWLRNGKSPQDLIGKTINYADHVGSVAGIEGDFLVVHSRITGTDHRFSLPFIRSRLS